MHPVSTNKAFTDTSLIELGFIRRVWMSERTHNEYIIYNTQTFDHVAYKAPGRIRSMISHLLDRTHNVRLPELQDFSGASDYNSPLITDRISQKKKNQSLALSKQFPQQGDIWIY